MNRAAVVVAVFFLGGIAGDAAAQIRAQVFVSGLSQPVGFVQDPTDSTVQYVIEKGGRIRVVKNGVLQATDFLNLTGQVSTGSEQGLLGLAFDPDYATNGRAFVNFTGATATIIARFNRSSGNPLMLDASTRFDLTWPSENNPGVRTPYILQPGNNHNGGHLAFGPDGYLYIGMGDGGGGGGHDPDHRAQNPTTLHGKMLRVDVDVADSDPEGYDIPLDNPFVDNVPIDAYEEIWAFGFRNPWKYSFDNPALGGTGALIIGDVGQNGWEEIDYEPAGAGGRNYGWHNREGTHTHPLPPCDPDPEEPEPGCEAVPPPAYLPLTDPTFEYVHPIGNSITGGFVYRGAALPARLRGRYFYADFVSGRVWSLGLSIHPTTGEATVVDQVEHTFALSGQSTVGLISAFGVDLSGELYIVGFSGTIWKIVPTSSTGRRGRSDFDNDTRGDLTVWRETTNFWYTAKSSTNFMNFVGFQWGDAKNDRAAPADYDGDGIADLGVWRPITGIWSVLLSGRNFIDSLSVQWGRQDLGDRPVAGDYDGDGKSDPAVWREGTGFWYLLRSSTSYNQYSAIQWGRINEGDVPVPGDYDGDGKTDPAVWRAPTGFWYALLSGSNYSQYLGVQLGSAASVDDLVPADYDGDGKTDPAVWRPETGNWMILRSSAGYALQTIQWGRRDLTDQPVPADYDGDGKADPAVWRRSSGTWYVLRSTSGYAQWFGVQWGSTNHGDTPAIEK
jgi:glucose/arabinose dehydrogenase